MGQFKVGAPVGTADGRMFGEYLGEVLSVSQRSIDECGMPDDMGRVCAVRITSDLAEVELSGHDVSGDEVYICVEDELVGAVRLGRARRAGDIKYELRPDE